MFYQSWGKRVFDLVLVVPALIVLLPLLFFIALLVRFKLGSPVLFRQTRPGLNERPFVILKFRTMTDARDENNKLLPDAERVTYFGAFLRKTSIDELPELFNVLKGEMSIVGPRPFLMEYLPYYTSRERLRHSVRPGITGLSQISGRNYLQWNERLETDVKYVENMSAFLDIKIIFQTVCQVIRTKNVAVVPAKIGNLLSEYRKQLK